MADTVDPKVQEYLDLHNTDIKDIAKAPKEEVKPIDEAKVKAEAEAVKVKAETEAKVAKEQKEAEDTKLKQVADDAALKAKEAMTAELKKNAEDEEKSKKEKVEEEARIKAKWTGKDEKTGTVTPKDYDEIVAESVRIAKEEATRLFETQYEARKAKEAEEAKVKTEAQKADDETKKKAIEAEATSERDRISREMDVLIKNGNLEKPVDINNEEEPATKKYKEFLNSAIKYNVAHPEAIVRSPIEFFHYHYKATKGPAGADAPIGGNRSIRVSQANDEKYNYVKDHGKSFKQITSELRSKFFGGK